MLKHVPEVRLYMYSTCKPEGLIIEAKRASSGWEGYKNVPQTDTRVAC